MFVPLSEGLTKEINTLLPKVYFTSVLFTLIFKMRKLRLRDFKESAQN